MSRLAVAVFAALGWLPSVHSAADPLNDRANTPAGYAALPSGLAYRVIKRAEDADEMHVDAESIVRVRAHGRLMDGREFWRSDKPVELLLTNVIAGWREGLPLMRPGDRFSFWIPPSLAYGAEGRAPAIPPNAALIFDIELVDVIETPSEE